MLVVALTIDRVTGAIVAGPEIASRGFVYMKEADDLMEQVKTAVREALAGREESEIIDKELIGATVRSAVRRFINQRFQRKPEAVVEDAIVGMLPHTKLGRAMASKLKIYRGDKHPHQAQKPEAATMAGKS